MHGVRDDLHVIPYSGPFKPWVSNNRLSQIRAGGRNKSKLISVGYQISAGVGRQLSVLERFHD